MGNTTSDVRNVSVVKANDNDKDKENTNTNTMKITFQSLTGYNKVAFTDIVGSPIFLGLGCPGSDDIDAGDEVKNTEVKQMMQSPLTNGFVKTQTYDDKRLKKVTKNEKNIIFTFADCFGTEEVYKFDIGSDSNTNTNTNKNKNKNMAAFVYDNNHVAEIDAGAGRMLTYFQLSNNEPVSELYLEKSFKSAANPQNNILNHQIATIPVWAYILIAIALILIIICIVMMYRRKRKTAKKDRNFSLDNNE